MTSPVIGTPWKKLDRPVTDDALEGIDKYWRAANYMSIGQIYLRSNPLMKEPVRPYQPPHRRPPAEHRVHHGARSRRTCRHFTVLH